MINFKLTLAATAALAFAVATPASATIYNTLGGAENGGDSVTPVGAGPILADIFVANTNANVGSITLNLLSSQNSNGFFNVILSRIDPNFKVGDTSLTTIGATASVLVGDGQLATSFARFTVTLPTPFALVAGATYEVGISAASEVLSSAVLGNTLDPAVLARPGVVAGGYYFNNGGVQANAGGPYELSVNAVPEPAALALFGLGGIALIARTRRARG